MRAASHALRNVIACRCLRAHCTSSAWSYNTYITVSSPLLLSLTSYLYITCKFTALVLFSAPFLSRCLLVCVSLVYSPDFISLFHTPSLSNASLQALSKASSLQPLKRFIHDISEKLHLHVLEDWYRVSKVYSLLPFCSSPSHHFKYLFASLFPLISHMNPLISLILLPILPNQRNQAQLRLVDKQDVFLNQYLIFEAEEVSNGTEEMESERRRAR